MNKLFLKLSLLLLFILTCNSNVFAQDVLFFLQNDVLYRYQFNTGTEVSRDFSTEDNINADLIFDDVNDILYWDDNGTLKSMTGNFTGSTPFTTHFSLLTAPNITSAVGLAIDPANSKIYVGEKTTINFVDYTHNIVTYDLSAANPVSTRTVIVSFAGNEISSIVVDVPNNRLYWAQQNTKIAYSDLSGNSVTTLINLSELFTIRKDPLSERIIWTQGNGPSDGLIRAISTSGGATTTLYTESYNSATDGYVAMMGMDILSNGDMVFSNQIAANTFASFTNVLKKGNVASSPISASNVTGTSLNTTNSQVVSALATGTLGGTSAPEIELSANSNNIADGSNLAAASTTNGTDFANVCVEGGTAAITYTITNSGGADLDLTGSSLVDIISGDTGDFSVTTQPATDPIPHTTGNTTTFVITFDSTTSGERSATVSIANNDSDEDPFDFVIKGTGINPTVTVAATTPTVSEDGAIDMVFRFTRTDCTSGSLVVNFSIAGTAADSDYSVSGATSYDAGINTGTITFGDGDSTVELTVNPTGDSLIEANETVVVKIEPSS